MQKIKSQNKVLWYNHELVARKFCNDSLTFGLSYVQRIMDCTLLGYDRTIYNTKRMECIEKSFGGEKSIMARRFELSVLIGSNRILSSLRSMLCNREKRDQLHLAYAKCYYGENSEEVSLDHFIETLLYWSFQQAQEDKEDVSTPPVKDQDSLNDTVVNR